EDVADGVRATQAQVGVCFPSAHRVGVPDDNDLRNGETLDRFQDLGDKRSRVFRQRLDSNSKYRMKCFGAGGRAASASPNNRSTSPALMVVTGPGGPSAVTRVVARGLVSGADPNSFDARARPVMPLSGSGSNAIVVRG